MFNRKIQTKQELPFYFLFLAVHLKMMTNLASIAIKVFQSKINFSQ